MDFPCRLWLVAATLACSCARAWVLVCNEDMSGSCDALGLIQREVLLSDHRPFFGIRTRHRPEDEVQMVQAKTGQGIAEASQHKQKKMILSPQLVRNWVRAVVLQLHRHVESYQAFLEEEHESALKASNYIAKLKTTLGRKGTLFGDVVGLIPRGQMDDMDRALAIASLGLFRDPKFAKALLACLKTLSDQVQQYRWRVGKRVSELTVKSANASEEKLPLMLESFFSGQHTTLTGIMNTVEKAVRETLAALPGEYTVMAALGTDLTNEVFKFSHEVLDNNTQAILKSRGGKFCGGIDIMMAEELVPIANQTVNALLVVNDFATNNMPQVTNETAQMSKILKGTSKALSLLYEESGAWVERICGLVGAAAM